MSEKKTTTEERLAARLKKAIAGIDLGMHCWSRLPSGRWFCTEDADGEGGKGILHCYINERVDSCGYPAGEMLADCGIVHDESECDDVAAYVLQRDRGLAAAAA